MIMTFDATFGLYEEQENDLFVYNYSLKIKYFKNFVKKKSIV
jgi:hypothetical protein